MTKEELEHKIQLFCDDNPYEPYIGYEMVETDELLNLMKDVKWEQVEEWLNRNYVDYFYVSEYWDSVLDNEFKDDFKTVYGDEYDLDEIRDEMDIYIPFEIDMRQLFRNTGNYEKRVVLFSNYDQICSHYYESSDGYYYNLGGERGYFSDMVDALNLNPKKVKKAIIDSGYNVRGSWPDKKSRDGKEIISYDDLIDVLLNNCCGGCLTFVINASFLEEYDHYLGGGTFEQEVIPEGTFCTIFDSFKGGGSIFVKTLKTFKVDIDKEGYPTWGVRTGGYHVEDVYGQIY